MDLGLEIGEMLTLLIWAAVVLLYVLAVATMIRLGVWLSHQTPARHKELLDAIRGRSETPAAPPKPAIDKSYREDELLRRAIPIKGSER